MDWIIWFLVGLLIFCVFFLPRLNNQTQEKGEPHKKTHTVRRVQSSQAATPMFNASVKVTSSSYDVDCFLAAGEKVSRLYLGGYENLSGGYVNYSRFKVVGMNSKTGRKNTRHYEAKDQTAAAEIAIADGLAAPFDITPESHKRDIDTEKYYISQLNDYRVTVPEGALKEDLRDILDRVRYSSIIVSEKKVGQDEIIQTVKAMPGPSEEFALFAHEIGIKFSRYISELALFNATVCLLADRDKAAFFAYCVLCSQEKKQIGDFRKSELAGQLYDFADHAIQNSSLMQSIANRTPSDYVKPHKGTTAYKAVKAFFG